MLEKIGFFIEKKPLDDLVTLKLSLSLNIF